MRFMTTSRLGRLTVCLVLGILVGVIVAVWVDPVLGALVGWSVTALAFVVVTFAIGWPMDGEQTRAHAMRDDPSAGISETLCLVASVASIVGIGVLLAGAHAADGREKLVDALVAVATVVTSWLLVHTTYTLRYAGMYYDDNVDAKIDFNEDDGYLPSYSDFYYVGFDMGTTYQISDTSVSGRTMRKRVTGHGLLGYVFGTVIVATVVNVVVSLMG